MEKKIRCLKPNEIEIRVQQVLEKGVQLLLYKDSRCDKRILDEAFGTNGWKNKYEEIKGNLFCTISIWDDDKKQWIDKCDCGTESFSEKEKGEASDAFKRAGFNVGIGRELYTRIFYFANVPTKLNSSKKYELENKYEKFEVAEIFTNEETEKIEKIKIADSKGNIVFSYGYKKQKLQPNNTSPQENKQNEKLISDAQKKLINTLLAKFENKEIAKKELYDHFKITTIKDVSSTIAKQMVDYLKEKVGE